MKAWLLWVATVLLSAGIAVGVWLWRRSSSVPGARDAPDAPDEIDRAIDRVYPDTRDHRFGVQPGPDETEPPLVEIVAYRVAEPEAHWHYITRGLSGHGIELTLRVAVAGDGPPSWPMNLLRWLAARVRDGVPYGAGHSVPFPGLLRDVSPETQGAGFVVDRVLGTLETPRGAVTFLQVLPLAMEEYLLMGRWDADKVFAELRAADPALIWRPGRTSLLAGERGPAIERQARADGSMQAVDYTGDLSWDGETLFLDALNRIAVLKFLRFRVAYGRPATIRSEGKVLTLEPGPLALHLDGEHATLAVPSARAGALADELAAAGSGAVIALDGVRLFRLGDMDDPLAAPFR